MSTSEHTRQIWFLARAITILALVSMLGGCASNPRAMKAAADIAYKYSPVAGLVLDGINLLTTVYNESAPVQLNERQDYPSCALSIQGIPGWEIKDQPEGTEPIKGSTQTLWYESGDAMLQIVCVPLSVKMPAWAQGTINALSKSFSPMKFTGQGPFDFQAAKAHWLAYKGSPPGHTQVVRGYMVLVYRGNMGLIISAAVPIEQYEAHAPQFRAIIDSVKLSPLK